MEETLKKALRPFLLQASPDQTDKFCLALGIRKSPQVDPADYSLARSSGLSIAEAESAIALAEELKKVSLETLIARLEHTTSGKLLHKFKRKHRRGQEDSETSKKTKL